MPDVLIQGVEMPEDRSLWLLIRPDGTVFKIKGNDKLGVPKEGAAIFLPEGHGRLIDGDALMEIMRAHDYPLTAHFNSTDNGMFTLGIQQAVNEAPTIVPAEGGTDNGF